MNNVLLGSTPKTYPASLLLNFDGSNNSTTFTDSSNTSLTMTNVGTPIISTAQSKFGGSSGYFNGSSSLTNSSLSLGTSDFTIEAWIYCTALNTPQTIVNQGDSDTAGNFLLWITNNNKIAFYADNNDRIGSTASGGNTTISPNQWYHIAFTRSGSTYKIFVNGSLDGTYVGGFDHNGSPFKVGDGYGGIRYFNGYIDNLRVTKGVALYQSDYFIPPYYSSSKNATIAPKLYNHIVMVSTKSSGDISGSISTSTGFYTINWYDGTKITYSSSSNFSKAAVGGNQYITIYPSAGVALLLHFNGSNGTTTFINSDSSSNNTGVSQNGSVTISTTQSKFGGSSAYFDGSSFLSFHVKDSYTGNDFILSGDFTVEFWVYPTVSFPTGGGEYVLWFGLSSGDGDYIGIKGGDYVAQFGGTGEMFWSGSPTINTWTHIALVRSGSTVTLYVNGTSLGDYTNSTPWLNQPNLDVQIGAFAGQFLSTGYIDEFRIIKNQALYKSNFTPSTIELTSNINADLSGYFYNVDVSNNSLTLVRPFYSRFIASLGYQMPGSYRSVYFYSSYWSRGYRSVYYPGAYVAGSPYHLDISSNLLDSSSLNQIYTDLLNGNGTIDVSDNTGGDSDNPSIATAKGYTVFGSVAPYTTLLLNLNSNYTDSSSQNIAVSGLTGSPSFSTSIKKYGSASLSLNGGATIPSFGTSSFSIPDLSQVDWTIEFWIYRPTATAGYEGIIYLANSSNIGLNMHLYTNNSLNFNDASGPLIVNNEGIIGSGQWYHVAGVSRNNVKKLFINGTLVGSATNPTPSGPYKLSVGRSLDGYWTTNGLKSTAYIDDLRIIRGKALYTSNFTPPTSQLTNYP
jgi:hypothetical protein